MLFHSNPALAAPVTVVSITGPLGVARTVTGPDFDLDPAVAREIVSPTGVQMLLPGLPTGEVIAGSRASVGGFYLN